MNRVQGSWTLALAVVMMLLFSLFLALYSSARKENLALREELAQVEPLSEVGVGSATKRSSGIEDHGLESVQGAVEEGFDAGRIDLQEEILAESAKFLAQSSLGGRPRPKADVEVLDLAGGDFLVRISAADLFSSGSAKVTPAMRAFVDRIGERILKSGRRLRIEGHADFDDSESIQRKISSFSSTWELSAARASGLAHYWMQKFDFDPMKIEVVAYGKYRPLEKRLERMPQANRRLEIIIVRSPTGE